MFYWYLYWILVLVYHIRHIGCSRLLLGYICIPDSRRFVSPSTAILGSYRLYSFSIRTRFIWLIPGPLGRCWRKKTTVLELRDIDWHFRNSFDIDRPFYRRSILILLLLRSRRWKSLTSIPNRTLLFTLPIYRALFGYQIAIFVFLFIHPFSLYLLFDDNNFGLNDSFNDFSHFIFICFLECIHLSCHFNLYFLIYYSFNIISNFYSFLHFWFQFRKVILRFYSSLLNWIL